MFVHMLYVYTVQYLGKQLIQYTILLLMLERNLCPKPGFPWVKLHNLPVELKKPRVYQTKEYQPWL